MNYILLGLYTIITHSV